MTCLLSVINCTLVRQPLFHSFFSDNCWFLYILIFTKPPHDNYSIFIYRWDVLFLNHYCWFSSYMVYNICNLGAIATLWCCKKTGIVFIEVTGEPLCITPNCCLFPSARSRNTSLGPKDPLLSDFFSCWPQSYQYVCLLTLPYLSLDTEAGLWMLTPARCATLLDLFQDTLL